MMNRVAPFKTGDFPNWKFPCEIFASISLVGSISLRFLSLQQFLNLKETIGFFSSILSYYFFFIRTGEKRSTSSILLASSFSLAAAIFSMEITGGVKSPLLLYVFAVIICLPFKIPPFTAITYSSLTLAIISAQVLSSNVEFASLIFKVIFAFIPFILIFTFLLSKKLKINELQDYETQSKDEYFEEKNFIYKLWELLDFIEDIPKASDEKDLITSFLKYLGSALGSKDIILVFKSRKKIVQYRISDGNLVGSEVSAYFNFDSVKKQERIELSSNTYYKLLENYPNASVYARIPEEVTEENLNLIRIAADLFLRKTQEMELSSRKNVLYDEILNLSELAELVSEETRNRELLEKAVNSLRVYSHIEKSLGFFCNEKNKHEQLPDKSSWIIKGRYIKHPEEFWINDFVNAARESIKTLKPTVRAASKGSSNVFAVPVIAKDRCIAVLGGVTSLNTEDVRKVIEFAEIVASLLSGSLSNLEAFAFLKTDKTEKLATVYEFEKASELLSKISELQSKLKKEISVLKNPLAEAKKLSNVLYDLIFDLLCYYETDNGHSNIDLVLNMLRNSLKHHGFDFISKTVVSRRIPPIYEFKILSITISLVLNSFLHSGSAKCYLHINEENERLRIQVKDEGVGFDIKRVIDLVKRNPEKYTGFRKVSRLVNEMNGKLKIRSSPGKGTEIIIDIPIFHGSS